MLFNVPSHSPLIVNFFCVSIGSNGIAHEIKDLNNPLNRGQKDVFLFNCEKCDKIFGLDLEQYYNSSSARASPHSTLAPNPTQIPGWPKFETPILD